MTTESARHLNFEQVRESVNTLRVIAGLLLVFALLLYFFHLAEVPMGESIMGTAAAVFAAVGAVMLWVGQHKLRALR
ncbi:MAG: hypothetical protein CXZ00_13860 [Acidobacteria bacterium]|nr:MAG: hypothetical protein CXZ00_13860 [Acidobacteriota bacterium]